MDTECVSVQRCGCQTSEETGDEKEDVENESMELM